MKPLHIFLVLTSLFTFQLVFSQNNADSVLINGQETNKSVETRNKKASKGKSGKKKNKLEDDKSEKNATLSSDSIPAIPDSLKSSADSATASSDSSDLFVGDSTLYKVGGDDIKEPIIYKSLVKVNFNYVYVSRAEPPVTPTVTLTYTQ